MYIWWSLCILYLLTCHVRVTVGNSGFGWALINSICLVSCTKLCLVLMHAMLITPPHLTGPITLDWYLYHNSSWAPMRWRPTWKPSAVSQPTLKRHATSWSDWMKKRPCSSGSCQSSRSSSRCSSSKSLTRNCGTLLGPSTRRMMNGWMVWPGSVPQDLRSFKGFSPWVHFQWKHFYSIHSEPLCNHMH